MKTLLFGTGGVPHSTPKRSSVAGIRRIRELGLGCMELAFVRRVAMGEKTALEVRRVAEENDVRLSVHAPYYVNLNSPEADKVRASRQRILQAARIGWLCGAQSVVFHPAFYHDNPPQVVYERVRGHLMELVDALRAEGNGITLRPETTGKVSQFGTLEELLRLGKEIEGVSPCVDFAHIHARTGGVNSYEEFTALLEGVEQELGRAALQDMHIHVSGIKYGPGGEKEHLDLADADLRYVELLQALSDYEVGGLVICESPSLEEDALLMQNTYRRLAEPEEGE